MYEIYEFYYPERDIRQLKVLIPEWVYQVYQKMPYESKEDQAKAKAFLFSHTGGMEWFIQVSAFYVAIFRGYVDANGRYPVIARRIDKLHLKEVNEWPDIIPEKTFDWSLPIKEIDRTYKQKSSLPNKAGTISPLINQAIVSVAEKERNIQSISTFLTRFKRKYPFAFESLCKISPDMPRWIYDNLVNRKSEL